MAEWQDAPLADAAPSWRDAPLADEKTLRASLNTSLESNPDQYARAREIASKTSLPPEMIERNLETLDRFTRTSEMDDMLRSLPRLREQMMIPDFAKVAHDDVEQTGAIERGLRNVGAGVGPRLYEGFYGAAQGLAEQLAPRAELGMFGPTVAALERMFGGRLYPATPAETSLQQMGETFGAWRRGYAATAERWTGDMSDASTVEKGVYGGLQSFGQQVPLLAAAVLMKNPAIMTVGMSAEVAGQEYGQARDLGITPDAALQYGVTQGAIEYITERIPVGKLFGDLEKNSGILKTLVGQMMTEIPTEQVATVLQDLNQWVTLNPEKPFADYLAERPGAAAETLIATLIAAGAQTGAATAIDSIAQQLQKDSASAELADANAKRLAEIAAAAEASKLRERSPDLFERFVQRAAEDGDLTDVYVDARRLGEVLDQAGLTPEQVSPAVAEQFTAARAVGGDVRIPIGEFAARIVGQDYAQNLMPHLRASPDAMSQAEAETFQQSAQEKMKAEAERVLEVQADDVEYQQSVARVEATLQQQLTKANRFTKDVNGAYAALMRDFYVTTADKLGISPEEMYARYPLRITAENIAGAQMDQQNELTDIETARALRNTVVEEGGEHVVLEGDNVNQNASVSNIRRTASARLANANVGPVAPGMTRFRHFGNRDDVAALDPKFMGTGMKGEERFRQPEPQLSLYPDAGFQKELGVGPHEFVVDVPTDRLYDANKDELGLNDKSTVPTSFTVDEQGARVPAGTRFDMSEFERQVKGAGYAGFVTPDADGNLKGQARMFESIPVEGARDVKKLRDSGVLFQLAPEHEPHGFAAVKPFITSGERAQLRRHTAAKLVQVFKDLPKDADFAAAALAGAAKKGWYAHSARAIRQVFGDADAPRFAALLGALSPQVPLDVNLVHAAQTWTNWNEAGRPTDEKTILEILDRSVWGGTSDKPALGAWRDNVVRSLSAANADLIALSGPKVDSFMRNLLGDVQEVTNDTWMANFAFINQTLFAGKLTKSGSSKRPGYVAMNAKIRRVAARLTKETGEEWTAPEVQETVWSWAKTAVELADIAGETRSVEDLVRAGAITDERVASAPDFATMFKENRPVREILEAAGYGDAIKAIEVEFGRGSARAGAGAPAVTPGLLRSARRLDRLRAQRDTDEADTRRRSAEREEVSGEVPDGGLTGLPDSSPGPLPAIREAAQRYIDESLVNKSDLPPHTIYVKADPERGARIAQAYEDAQHQPDDFEVQVAYDALIDETLAQYEVVKKLGIEIEMIAPGENPYPEGPRQVFEDVRRGHLWVYPTDGGYGAEVGGSKINHPMLRVTNEKIGDRVLLANDVFRIVHDIFGHAKEGNGFGPNGEENAWHSHVRMYSPLAARAMSSETRGQNSWVNFGPHGEANRSNQKETVYAEQKATLLPDEIVMDGILEGGAQPAQVLEQPARDDDLLKGPDGKPLTVYHGTRADFKEFQLYDDIGIHFGTLQQASERIEATPDALTPEDLDQHPRLRGNNIRPARLRLKNPLRTSDVGAFSDADQLINYGLDGALTPSQLKRVTEEVDVTALDSPADHKRAIIKIQRLLKEFGYDGIVYKNEGEARETEQDSYIVFDPSQIVHLDEMGVEPGLNQDLVDGQATGLTELAQGQTSAPRGQISLDGKGGATISLLQNADLSTFLHESGHFFLEVYADLASQNAPVAADFQKLLDWFGVESPQAWQSMTLEQRRPHHEKFARGFEAYLFEGNAPTSEVTSLFAKFRSWLISVYQTLTALNVELTPEVRSVMGRMIAADDKIAATERARSFTPLFPTPADAGMTDDEFREYAEASEVTHEQAVAELEKRSLRDMRWASRARGKVLKELQAEVNEKRDALRKEVTEDVRAEPIYQALRFIRSGELTMETGETLTEAGEHKLDRETIEKLGVAIDDKLLKRGGVHPDLVAEMFGFRSGDHLLKELAAAEPIGNVIEAMTDRRMLERYGDITDRAALERAADEAVHSEARGKFVATEIRALNRMLNVRAPSTAGGSVNLTTKAAKEFAEATIARRKIRDVQPSQFLAAESRAGKAAEAALASGDLQVAAAEKRNQLVNLYATRAAMDAQRELERAITYLRKFDNESTRKSLDEDYLDQIDALLERFDLRRRTASDKELAKRASLLKWVEAQRDLGFEPDESVQALAEEARRVPYREATVEQFRGLVDAVRNVEHLGRLKKKLLTSAKDRELQEAVESAAQSIKDNAKKTIPEKIERNGFGARLKEGVEEFFAMHRKFASIVRQMDGFEDGGTLWELLVRPLNKAGDAEAEMRAAATKKLSALFKPLLKQGALRTVTEIPGTNIKLSREGRLSVALNWGNDTNRLRVLEGDKWTPTQVRAILDTLTKPEWDFVQGVWDFIGSYWPEISAKQKRVTGITPEQVSASPVQTKFGALKGGYYPIKYDPFRSSKAEADTMAETLRQAMQGLYTRATTRRGHTKARVESVKRPVRKDLGVVFEHLEQVVHDLAFHEYLIDANRILRAAPVDSAIREHHGPQYLRQMRNALDDVARGDVPAQNAFERALNHIRTGATVAGLGWNLTTSLMQPLGLTQSMARIGPKWVGRGLARWIGDATRMESSVKFIHDKSKMMKLRAQTMQREIHEIQGRIHGDKRQAITSSFFYLIQKMQMVADVPTWLGAYEKAMDSSSDEALAVALADQAVLDSQGGGQVKDLAAIQRGGPALKLWTNFYSFFNTTYNLLAESKGGTNFKKPADIGKLAADVLLLTTIPATLAALMKIALGGGDDDDELGETLIRENLSYLLGTMLLARELGSVVSGYSYRGPAGARFITELGGLIQQAEQGEPDAAALKAANTVAGILFHYPAGQVQRTAEGVAAIANGDTSNPVALISGAQD